MNSKPSYDELEQRLHRLQQEIASRPHAEQTLEGELRKFRTLYELSLAMTGDNDLEHNLRLVVGKSRELVGTDLAFLALKGDSPDEMYFHTMSGARTEAFRNLRFPIKDSMGGRVFESRHGVIVLEYAKETRLQPPALDVVLDEGLVSGMAVPVQMGENILGTLYVFDRSKRVFDPESLETLTLIGNMAAVEIHRQRVKTDLERFQTDLERRVEDRTSRLTETNVLLRLEIQERKKMETALRRSEERFQEMAHHIREVFWLFDWERQRVIYVSPAYEQMWGRPIERLYSRHDEWSESIHPDDVEFANASFARIPETGGGEAREYRIIRPDGSVRWVSDRGFAIRDNAGKVIRIAGIAEDITERRRVVEENLQRQQFLESVLYHAPDAVVTLDAENRVVDWNPGAATMFGYTSEEASGKKLDDLVAKFEMTKEASSVTRRVLAGERIESFETVRYRKDGTPVHVIVAGSPIMTDGILVGAVAIYTDISALKKVENALRESEEQMRAIFHTIPDPVTVVRFEDGICLDVNEAFTQVTGYAPDEMIGKTALDIDVWVDPEKRSALYRRLSKQGEVKNLEARFRLKNGSVIDGLMSARMLSLNGVPHFISITRDISALKDAQADKEKLEAQLKQAQKMEAIGTLAGGIAHDFNNLLMGIQGRNSLMLADVASDHPLYEHLRGIEGYVRRAADLTKQLLGFARGGKYEVKPIDPNALVAENIALFARTRKELTIHTRYQRGVWSVDADRHQIEQVLLNLLVNAWQAMPGGGDLCVETVNVMVDASSASPPGLESGNYVKISVTDTGVGMDTATQERIFDPFFTTKAMGRGSGLGLASAYGIVKNHGGIINVYSEKGEGSTFAVYLPASYKAPVAEKMPAETLITGSGTVLLVDDEEMILQVGKKMLTRLGYKVLTANGGQEALKLYNQHGESISLVILDVIMPGMGGGETFAQLKAMDPGVVVLLSSGYSINHQASEIIEEGCNGFIQKPFDIHQLSRKIRSILGG